MLQAVCFIYPWDVMLPDSVRYLKDSYCIKVSAAGPPPLPAGE
jgi:hypothetical protein